jgi:UDP-N-acetylmuramoyl-tripeptide--D-alanyl-D-alanine ligase
MLSIRDIIKATGGSIVIEGNAEFTGVSIDSRTIKSGELFIALKGDRFDGHDFLIDALMSGGGAVVNNLQFMAQGLSTKDKTIVLVDNTLLALHNLARYMRKKFKGHVIGVVGSNGKTTTKELASSILGARLNILKTSGNLNNHIGMPLSITKMDKSTRIMVLEMGTNRPGDVDELCSIALPDIGVITNIGYEHLQGFGSLYKVRSGMPNSK